MSPRARRNDSGSGPILNNAKENTVSGWLETYRGIVYRWEVDHNDHLTVAFYFARLGDAAHELLDALGLGFDHARRRSRLALTTDCYVRYLRELRVGDIMHIASGVLAVEPDARSCWSTRSSTPRPARSARPSSSACATSTPGAAPPGRSRPLQRRAAERRRVDWDGPARERRPRPAGLEGFRDSARDTVKPDEVDVFGQVALAHYIHRFSAANGHATAAFGITPGYMRSEGRGFSTFEFQLEVGGVLRPGDPVCVRSALVHVGSSSMRLLHVMSNARTAERHRDARAARRPPRHGCPAAQPLPDAIRERAKAMLVV